MDYYEEGYYYEREDEPWTLVQRKRRRPRAADRAPVHPTTARYHSERPSYAAVVRGDYQRRPQRPPAVQRSGHYRRVDRYGEQYDTQRDVHWQNRRHQSNATRPTREHRTFHDQRQRDIIDPPTRRYYGQQQNRDMSGGRHRQNQQTRNRATTASRRRQATQILNLPVDNLNRRPQTRRQLRDVTARPAHQVTSNDPDFNIKVRVLHNIIKCVHHLNNVTSSEIPPMIHKMTINLASFIRPSSPTDTTQTLLEGNAKNWQYTTLQILQDHYEKMLEAHIKQLTTFDSEEWRGPFQIAGNWARRNLGKRLRGDTLQQAEAMIVSRLLDLPLITADNVPPPPASPPAAEAATITVTPATMSVTPLLHAAPSPIVDSSSSVMENRRPPPLTAATQRMGHETTAPQTQTVAKSSVATSANAQEIDWLIQLSDRESTSPPAPCPFTDLPAMAASVAPVVPVLTPIPPPPEKNEKSKTQALTSAPREQRQLKLDDIFRSPHNTDPPPPPPLTPTIQLVPRKENKRQQNPCAYFDVDQIMDLITEEALPTPSRRITSPPPLPLHTPTLEPAVTPRPDDNVQREQPPVVAPPQAPISPLCRPQRHINTLRKLKDWSLHIKKRNVILGDSNLSKFPAFRDQHLQVDSYPGANFRHAAAILQRASTSVEPEVIILAFGINHRAQKAKVTAFKQLQTAVRTARQRFPKTHIVVPLINYSCSLPKQERATLSALNECISSVCDHMPKLPTKAFNTGTDLIHWTPRTAAAILEHWRAYLN